MTIDLRALRKICGRDKTGARYVTCGTNEAADSIHGVANLAGHLSHRRGDLQPPVGHVDDLLPGITGER
ncbi:hypothetical protein [Acidovorax sp. SUPP1855]|uniref:hypothetical protein n=1 Tax=Acidovorax sp. SUPP1855 TaxID=431774 RepID=UPI0024E11596|nr:hypothetical protein [Acidovorax sp. SUPP1855]